MTWQPAGAQGVRDTQDAIVRLLGFTCDTFLASSLMLQGAKSFASKDTPRVEKCVLLMDGLGLGEYDALMTLARDDRKAYERDALRLADRIERDAAELEQLPPWRLQLDWAIENESTAQTHLALTQHDVDCLTEAWQQAQARSAERRAAEAEHQQAEKERQRLREQAEQADSARDSISHASELLLELADADALAAAEQRYSEARAGYDRAAFERQTLEAKLSDAEERVVNAQKEMQLERGLLQETADQYARASDKGECRECGQALATKEAHRRAEGIYLNETKLLTDRCLVLTETIREQETQAIALGKELAALGVAVAPDDAEVRRSREQVQERARLEERISAWESAVLVADLATSALRTAEMAYASATQKLAALPPIDQAELDRIKQQGLEARAAVNDTQAALDTVRADKTRAQAEVERLTALQERHQAEKDEHAHALDEAALAGECERMYGRDGLPAYIIEKVAVPYLEEEATRILHQLGLRWEIQIRVEAARKSGDGTKPALDVVIVKENGVEQPYALASGGEDTRVARALQVAFARLFKHRRGAHSELFALDEPPYLDQAGLDAFAGLLDDLAREFAVVQLVSHDSGLRDSFPNRIEIVRENGRSRILSATAGLVTA